MRISGLALTAALALAILPITPPSLAAPLSPVPAVTATETLPLLEVKHRARRNWSCHRDVRRHYHRALGRSAWHRHVGNGCWPRIVRHHHRRHSGGCIWIGGLRFCF